MRLIAFLELTEDLTKGIMKAFYGQIGKRLPDAQGQVRFTFVHASGTILELKIGPGKPLPQEHQRVIAMGDLVGPGIIVGQ